MCVEIRVGGLGLTVFGAKDSKLAGGSELGSRRLGL